jgi:hypothetical protein
VLSCLDIHALAGVRLLEPLVWCHIFLTAGLSGVRPFQRWAHALRNERIVGFMLALLQQPSIGCCASFCASVQHAAFDTRMSVI